MTQAHTSPHNAPFILATDPNQALEQMMETIHTLKDVYIRETEALESSNTEVFLGLQDEKFTAAQNYQDGIAQIIARQEDMKVADNGLKNRLRKLQEEFTPLFQRNLEALERMNKTALRIGEKIRVAAMNEANKHRTLSYSENGYVTHDSRKMVSTGMIETA